MRKVVEVRQGVARHPAYRLEKPLDLTLFAGECVAVCGPNGGGKSFLVDMLTGAHPLLGDAIRWNVSVPLGGHVADVVRHVTFRDVYGGAAPAYYQQRWNRGDEAECPTVREQLFRNGTPLGADDPAIVSPMLEVLGVTAHLDKPVNRLSSGELRRLQLARVLLGRPQVLFIDNPYIGLDPEARRGLTEMLAIVAEQLTLVLVVSRVADIPGFVHKVVHVEQMRVETPVCRDAYIYNKACESRSLLKGEPVFPASCVEVSGAETVIDFRKITLRYGERTVLRDLEWSVKKGEHWALTGENGAGKTTLLSLVCADNPMSYACDVSLFGCRRGQGESIWEIKRRIGYVSPEMYSTYRKGLKAVEIVASGLRDSIGLYHRPSLDDEALCRKWLEIFGASRLADCNYLQLSDGEQRLVLLVRAFVKSPELLVLDEPFHGLDDRRRAHAMRIIDRYMENAARTLVMVTHYSDELPGCINRHLVLIKHK